MKLNDKRINTLKIKIRRMILEYRTPVLAMSAFVIFSILLTGSTCVMRTITGLPCPGCGLTRATFALFKFNIPAAIHFNPAVFLVWPVMIVFFLLMIFKKINIKKYTPLFIITGVCMCVIYAIRMILYFPEVEPMIYDYHSVFGRIFIFIKSISP